MAKTIATNEAFTRFRALAERLVTTPKAEVDARAKLLKAKRLSLKKRV